MQASADLRTLKKDRVGLAFVAKRKPAVLYSAFYAAQLLKAVREGRGGGR